MLKYQDVKDALQNERYNSSLPSTAYSEALKRLIDKKVIHIQLYAVVIYDRAKHKKDFDLASDYRYVFMRKDGGITNYDEPAKAPLFTWEEIPDDYKDSRIPIDEPLAEVTAEEVYLGLRPGTGEVSLTDRQKNEVVQRIRQAGLLKDSGLYYIHIVPEDDASYINVETSGAISLDDCCQTKYVKTTFTQDEIDNDPLLKALEQFKEPV